MDNFAEQLVKKHQTGSERTKKFLIMFGGSMLTFVLAAISVVLLGNGLIPFIGLLLAAGAGYGTFTLLQNMYVEYEYTFTNGELDIDKIIAKKKRKELVSLSVGKFTAFGKYEEDAPEETEDMTVIFASSNIASEEYYADLRHDQYGNTRLVFCPDEKMLENINKSLPRALKNKS